MHEGPGPPVFFQGEKQGILGCPGQEVRINGERINGLYHLLIHWGILGL